MDSSPKPLAIIMSWGEERSKIRLPILENTEVSIGRTDDNTISLSADKMVSRYHCAIRGTGQDMILKDLGSQNGTYLNGYRVLEESPIPIPSWLQVGNTRLAIFHPEVDQDEQTLVWQSIYSKEGSILIPPTAVFEELTEALMVADIVNSTALVRSGETLFIKVAGALGEMLERALWKGKNPYLQCTGDGFLACFSSADAALEAALGLGPHLRDLFDLTIQISVALHWGSTRVTAKGNRAGNNVHGVFSLEGLRHKEKKLSRYFVPENPVDLVLMTEAFLSHLKPASRNETISVGLHPLKGLDKKAEIFQWHPTGD